ncbi:MAG: hypothetical protein WAK57_00680 [Desulfobacterales bacterium]
MPEEQPDIEMQGVATLYKTAELRKFVMRYLYLIVFLEIFIFLVFFLCQLEPINIAFSWRNFFLTALLMPIAVTFLTGVFVTAFNLFFMPADAPAPEKPRTTAVAADQAPAMATSWHKKLHAAIASVRQLPFLMSLVLLCVAIVGIVHIDRLFAFFTNVSETAIVYGFWGIAIFLGGATLLAGVRLIARYRLEKDRQQQEFQYRQEMALRMGVIITGKNSAVHTKAAAQDNEGNATPLLTHHGRAGEEQT